MSRFVRRRVGELAIEDDVDLLALRYRAAYDEYHHAVGRNTELCMEGGRPSKQSRDKEEEALEELADARDALLDAALLAYPTIH